MNWMLFFNVFAVIVIKGTFIQLKNVVVLISHSLTTIDADSYLSLSVIAETMDDLLINPPLLVFLDV